MKTIGMKPQKKPNTKPGELPKPDEKSKE